MQKKHLWALVTLVALLAHSQSPAKAGGTSGIFREDSVRTDGVTFTRVRDTAEHRVCYVLSAQGEAWWFQGAANLNTASFQCFLESQVMK